MKQMLTLIFVLVCSVSAHTQDLEIVVNHDLLPTVRVTGQSVALMCEGFVKEFGVAPETGMISIKPKTLPFEHIEKMGQIWVVRMGNKEVEVESMELPGPLQNLSGPIARLVLRGTCYTKELSFFSPRDVVFVTANLTEAQVIARKLRGE